MDISKVKEWGWMLMIAGAGLMFSIFALINNEKFIALGLVTFLYGVMSHLVDKTYWNVYWEKDKENQRKKIIIYVLHALMMLCWIVISLVLFQKISY